MVTRAIGKSQELWRIISHIILFYCSTLKGLFRRQSLRIPKKPLVYKKRFYFSIDCYEKWHELFASKDLPQLIPLTYYSSHIVRSFLYLMNKLHINYKNLLHLKHEEEFINLKAIRPNQFYYCESILKEIIQLRAGKIALMIETNISNLQDEVLVKAKNMIFVKGINNRDTNKINASSAYGNIKDNSLIKLALKRPELDKQQSRIIEIFVPKKQGVRYGIVSGDMNFIHTMKIFAKLFGFKNVFIQGMCTVNYIFRYLVPLQHGEIQSISVTFTNPVYEEQKIFLVINESKFEITDEADKLLAYGEAVFMEK